MIVLVEGNTAKDKQVGVKASRVLGQPRVGRNCPSKKGSKSAAMARARKFVWAEAAFATERARQDEHNAASAEKVRATSKRVLNRVGAIL